MCYRRGEYDVMAECESHYREGKCEKSVDCPFIGDKAPKINKIVLANNKVCVIR